jgi:hypothetical protein
MNRLLLVIYIVIVLVLVHEIYISERAAVESGHDSHIQSGIMPDAPPVRHHAAASGESHAPSQSSPITATVGARQLNAYRDINVDASSFNLSEAQARAARAFESDVIMIDSPPIIVPPPQPSTIIPKDTVVTRVSSAAPGGITNTTASMTGGIIERPIVDPPAPTPPPATENERPDHRCGPVANGAKCGAGRCCSVYGWCGSPGEPHCAAGINAAIYNGPGISLPPGLSNGDVVRCANGTIYRIENNQKRLYPSLSVYEKYGRPSVSDIDCKVLDGVIPGLAFV